MKVSSKWLTPVTPLVVGMALLTAAGRGEAELAARLVRDIDPASYAGSSQARPLQPFLFTAFGGKEIWGYDHQEGFFSPILSAASIRPLGRSRLAWSDAAGKVRLGYIGTVHGSYYVATYRAAPWRSIGRTYDAETYFPLLFEAADGGRTGLWITGASANEAREIVRPLPLPDGRLVAGYAGLRERGYFVARHPTLGTALWSTDTTVAGTRVVFTPTPGRAVPMALVGVVRGKLLLALSGGQPELWTSDGTARGTRPFKKLARGTRGATVLDAFMAGGWAYLLVDDGAGGPQLWSSDGTPAGTRPLVRFAAAPPGGRLPYLAQGRSLLFFADVGRYGREPWWSDGTPSGTHLLADLCPGPCGTEGEPLAASAGDGRGPAFLFSARTPEHGLEPYWTDGSPAATTQLGDLCPGPCSSLPRDARGDLPVRTSALRFGFTAETTTVGAGAGERALFGTDGTVAGTLRLTPPGVRAVTGPSPWDAESILVFGAADADFGEELWMTQGTPESTRLMIDLGRELDRGSNPVFVGTAGERALFTAAEGSASRSLWASDGTEAGTVRLPLTGAQPSFSFPCAVSLGARALLTDGIPDLSQNAIWASDGTPGGTARLTPAELRIDSCPAVVGGRAVFFGTDLESGSEPWVSDGTPEGTHRLLDLAPGDGSSISTSPIAVLPARLLFRRPDGEVWQTDGTVAGTHPVEPALATLETGQQVAQVGERIFFVRTVDGQPNELWVADGPEATPRRIGFPPGLRTFIKLLAVGSRLYVFTGESALWRVDGAAEAAVPVIASGAYYPLQSVVFEGRLVFNHEGNLWLTDGTPEGTFPLRNQNGETIFSSGGLASSGDLAVPFAGGLIVPTYESPAPCLFWSGHGNARPIAGSPGCPALLRAGGRVFFPGFEDHTGVELWTLEER